MTAVPISGFCAPGFEAVQDAFEQNFADDLEIGAAFCVTLDFETVVDLRGGWADRAQTKVWSENTLVPVFSTTKPIAAVMIARLVDQGLLDYEKPLADIWPDFAQNGKERVTLGQALSHQAGVAAFVDPIERDDWFDPQKLAADLARIAPLWTPGSASGYHAMTFAPLVAEPARRADTRGRSVGVQLEEDLCRPFGIDFRIGRAQSEAERIAELKLPSAAADLGELTDLKRAVFMTRWGAPRAESAEWRDAEIASANGHGTAAAVAKLYSIYANGGRLEGKEVISPPVFAELERVRITGPELVLPFDIHWAAGIMRNNAGKLGSNPDSFGHGGRGGSVGMADPDRRLSAAYVMNKMSPALVGDARWDRLIAAVYSCF